MITFLSNSSWWITVALAMVVASIPSVLKPLRMVPLLLIVVFWLVPIINIAVAVGILAALAGGSISLFWGFLLMLISLLFSGVRDMAKKRYG